MIGPAHVMSLRSHFLLGFSGSHQLLMLNDQRNLLKGADIWNRTLTSVSLPSLQTFPALAHYRPLNSHQMSLFILKLPGFVSLVFFCFFVLQQEVQVDTRQSTIITSRIESSEVFTLQFTSAPCYRTLWSKGSLSGGQLQINRPMKS